MLSGAHLTKSDAVGHPDSDVNLPHSPDRSNVKPAHAGLREISMTDDATSVRQLRQLVQAFVDERDWQQFHSPKNLSMALAIEASELMEHFQWLTVPQSRKLREDADQLSAVGEEMADVFCYLLAMANELQVDLSALMEAKMEKNRRKYPAEEYRGRFGPQDPGPGREA